MNSLDELVEVLAKRKEREAEENKAKSSEQKKWGFMKKAKKD